MKYVKFIAKPNQWYKEGTEAFFEIDELPRRITVEEFKIHKATNGGWNAGIFVGCRVDIEGYEQIDGVLCTLEEFDIIETDEPLSFATEEELDNFYKQK